MNMRKQTRAVHDTTAVAVNASISGKNTRHRRVVGASTSGIGRSGSGGVGALAARFAQSCVLGASNVAVAVSPALSPSRARWGAVRVFAIRHGRRVKKLGRPADQRRALLRGLTTELLRHGRIKTHENRAKAMRKYVDHIITLAKRGDEHAKRQAKAFVYDSELVEAVFEEVPSRCDTRTHIERRERERESAESRECIHTTFWSYRTIICVHCNTPISLV